MPTRQTLPTKWLLTDQRLGDALWHTIEVVPRGGGVVLRHHHGDRALCAPVAALCRARGLMLAVAGDAAFAKELGAAMVHNPRAETNGLLVSRSIHSRPEALAARGADLLFVSPICPTASHSGALALGLTAALKLARIADVPAIALGGMDEARGAEAMAAGFHGWAAIGAWRQLAFLRS